MPYQLQVLAHRQAIRVLVADVHRGEKIDKTDAFDGTPVLGIKPFVPGYDSVEDAKVPEWAKSK